MPRNGSGAYARAVSAYVFNTIISQTDVNAEMDDIATALTASLAKDGQTVPTANLPMGGFKLTGLGAASGAGDAVRYEQLTATAISNTPAGSVAAATVQAAINELDTEKLALTGGTMTGGINSARGNITQHATTMDFFAVTSPDLLDGTGSAVTITACVNAPQAGAVRKFYPIVATVLTHGATFDCVGNANLTAAAGDCWIIEAKTASTYRVSAVKEDGTAVVSSSVVQIQPISASVGASALTISASALSLDFRSATLTSGAVTTVSGTPSNLVISNGSTLGTVSASASRIAILALNNAGTIELAAINMAGGNLLDESGVISTTAEGGAGAADSVNVAYSTTARSNVAYRVIGFIDSTQATAGTWASSLTVLQGAGGRALQSQGILLGTAIATTSGTSVDFSNIPAWVKRITVSMNGVSTSGTSRMVLRLGTAGGIQTSTYQGRTHGGQTTINTALDWTDGVELRHVNAADASGTTYGAVTFTLLDPANNIWSVTGADVRFVMTAETSVLAGVVTLSGSVTTLRLTTAGGADTFDAGSMNIAYE